MYDLFIKNTTLAQSEQRIYGVPISEAEAEANIPFTDPVIKTEMGKTGSCEFSMNPTNPYYNALRQMKTILRVVYDGTTLFRGRVLTIDNAPLTGEKKVHLEGDLAFLMDSIQEGVKEEDRPEIAILTYLIQLITNHNAQMNEDANSDKTFTLGEVPGNYTAATNAAQRVVVDGNHKFGNNSWVTTTSALENLAKEYGGYFRTRYVGGVCYLDWLDYCFQYDVNGQPIEIQENLIDLNSTTEVDNLFTALIPIGKADAKDLFIDGYKEDIYGSNNKRILVPDIVGYFTDEQLNKGYHSKADYQNAVSNYGILYKTQSFPNADTKEKLWNYAIDWIRENYVGGITSFDLSALDMHHLDGEVQKYLTGDRVQVIYPNMSAHTEGSTPTISKILTLISAQYYLYNPEKNKYSLGVPNLLLNREYGTSLKKESSGGGSSGGGGGYKKKQEEETTIREAQIAEYQENAWKYIVDKKNNFDIYEQLYNEDPVKADRALNFTHATIVEGMMSADGSSTSYSHKKRFQKMWFDGYQQKIEIAGPVDHSHDYTDEQVAAINQANRVMAFDGTSQSIGMYATLQTLNPYEYQQGKLLSLAKIGLTRDPDTGQLKEAANIKLWNDSRSTSDDAPSEVTVNGFGEVANKFLKVGKNGEGNLATVVVNGLQSTVNQFEPSTVIAGATPTKTIEQDGKNGGSMAAGSGGALDGWKITLNKPLQYTYTDEGGTTHPFTVQPGVVAADDLHCTNRYDSVRAELGLFDILYADYAQIGTLTAMNAKISNLQSDHVTTASFNAVKGNVDTIYADYLSSANISTKDLNFKTLTSARGSVSAATISGSGGVTSRTHELLIYDAEVSSDGKTLTLKRTLGSNVTFNKAVTLSAEYGGSGVTATYTVTADDQTSVGTFTLKINKDKAWIEDENGETRASINNTYAGDAATARNEGYKEGWNECIDNCSGEYYLTGYTNYNNGSSVALYVAPTGGASMATGSKQVWRYGGSRVYRYGIPQKM